MNPTDTTQHAILTAYLAGELDAAQREEVRRRLDASPEWRAALAELEPAWHALGQLLLTEGAPAGLAANRRQALVNLVREQHSAPLPWSAATAPAAAADAAPPAASSAPAVPVAPASGVPAEPRQTATAARRGTVLTPPVLPAAKAHPARRPAHPWHFWVQMGLAASLLVVIVSVWLHQPSSTSVPATEAHTAHGDAAGPTEAVEPASDLTVLAGSTSGEATAHASAPASPPGELANDMAGIDLAMADPPPGASRGVDSMARKREELAGAGRQLGSAPPAPPQVTPMAAPPASQPMATLKVESVAMATTLVKAAAPLPVPRPGQDTGAWERARQALLAGEPVAPADRDAAAFMAALVASSVPPDRQPQLVAELHQAAERQGTAYLLIGLRAPPPGRAPLAESAADTVGREAAAVLRDAVVTLSLEPALVRAWRVPGGEWQAPLAEPVTGTPEQWHHLDGAALYLELQLVSDVNAGRLATVTWQWREQGLPNLQREERQVNLPARPMAPRLVRLSEVTHALVRVLEQHAGTLPAAEAQTLLTQMRPLIRARSPFDLVAVEEMTALLERATQATRPGPAAAPPPAP